MNIWGILYPPIMITVGTMFTITSGFFIGFCSFATSFVLYLFYYFKGGGSA